MILGLNEKARQFYHTHTILNTYSLVKLEKVTMLISIDCFNKTAHIKLFCEIWNSRQHSIILVVITLPTYWFQSAPEESVVTCKISNLLWIFLRFTASLLTRYFWGSAGQSDWPTGGCCPGHRGMTSLCAVPDAVGHLLHSRLVGIGGWALWMPYWIMTCAGTGEVTFSLLSSTFVRGILRWQLVPQCVAVS